jgi:hypothetical protein
MDIILRCCCFNKKECIIKRIQNILIWQNVLYLENSINNIQVIQIYDKEYKMKAIIYFVKKQNTFEVIITDYFNIDFLKIYKNIYYDIHGVIKNDIEYKTLIYEGKTDSYIYSEIMNFIYK